MNMMAIGNMNSVLAELAVQLGFSELHFDEDLCCFLAFDTQAVNVQIIEERVYLTTYVVTLPQEVSAAWYEALLEANLYGRVTGDAVLAFEPESRGVVLQDKLDAITCTLQVLMTRLENLLAIAQSIALKLDTMSFSK